MSEATTQDCANEVETAEALPQFAPMQLPLLYLYLVASFGFYVLVWFARAGRVSRARLERGPHPFWWSAGALIPIVGGIALHRLARRTKRFAAEQGIVIGAGSGVAGLLYFGLASLSAKSPEGLGTVALLLFPIPLLLVQRHFNASWQLTPAPVSLGSLPRLSLLRGALTALGLLGIAALFHFHDRSVLVALLGDRLHAAERVEGVGASYSVEAPNALWSKVPPGTVGDDDSDLELHALGNDAWIVAYVLEGREQSLDDVVDSRRAVLSNLGTITSSNERRHFADANAFVPVSFADYEIRSFAQPLYFAIATADLGDQIVEVVGQSSEAGRAPIEVREIVESLQPTGTPP